MLDDILLGKYCKCYIIFQLEEKHLDLSFNWVVLPN